MNYATPICVKYGESSLTLEDVWMKSIMKKGLTAAALLLAANMANATVVSSPDTIVGPGLSTYTTSFSLSSLSSVSLNVAAMIPVGFAAYTAQLFSSSNITTATGGWFADTGTPINLSNLASSLNFGTQTAGNYSLTFTSFSAVSPLTLTLNTTAVAAVPEPETYALMGVGLLGLLAARRKKAQALVAA
jgi:peptidoglycan hydrolase-like protein with peptidoglycan-binding domain